MNTWRRVRPWLPVAAWMGLIFVASSQPNLPSLPSPTPDLLAKKGAHVLEYAVLAWLSSRALVQTTGAQRPALWALAIALLYALSDEWHQTFVPGRNGHLGDVLLDTIGMLVGLGFARYWAQTRPGIGPVPE